MKKMFITMTAILTATSSYAAVGTKPTCAQLGYNQNTTVCAEYDVLKCPFDQTKVFCKNPEPKACEMGDILYSDKKCYDITPKTKTPLAVVIDPVERYAIAFTPANNEGSPVPLMDEGMFNQNMSNGRMFEDTDENGLFVNTPWMPATNYNSLLPKLPNEASVKNKPQYSAVTMLTIPGQSYCTGDWFLPPIGVFYKYSQAPSNIKNKVNVLLASNGIPLYAQLDGVIPVYTSGSPRLETGAVYLTSTLVDYDNTDILEYVWVVGFDRVNNSTTSPYFRQVLTKPVRIVPQSEADYAYVRCAIKY